MHQRGILDLTSTYVSAPAGNIGLDPDLWNVDVKVSQTNNQLPIVTVGGTHFMRSSVEELSWAHIYKVKGSESGLVAQIIKVKHFKVKDISFVPNSGRQIHVTM